MSRTGQERNDTVGSRVVLRTSGRKRQLQGVGTGLLERQPLKGPLKESDLEVRGRGGRKKTDRQPAGS